MKHKLIELIYRKKLCKRLFNKWHTYALQIMEIKHLCIKYKRTGNRNADNKAIMNLIVSTHHYRNYLLRKYFQKWQRIISKPNV